MKFLIILPLILSSISNIYSCNFDNIPKPKFQPPGWVFSIVWSVIYLCFGMYMYLTFNEKNKLIYWIWSLNLIMNLLWSPLFTCYKQYKFAFYLMIILLLTNYMLFTLTNNKYAKLYMTPYIVWLHVALMLNVEIIKMS
jgi:translocator protein